MPNNNQVLFIVVDDDLHLDNTALVNFQYVKGKALVRYALTLYGKFAFYLEQKARKGLSFAFHRLKVTIVKTQNLREV